MGHTPYGYIIENGKAVIDETAALMKLPPKNSVHFLTTI